MKISLGPLLRRIAPPLLLALTALLFLAGSYFRVIDVLEYQTYDWRFRLKPPPPVADEIAFIEVSDQTLEILGQWPFRRNYHAALLEILRAQDARMAGFDMLFVEPSPDDVPLYDSARKTGFTYFVEALQTPRSRGRRLESSGMVAPLLDRLREAARGVGHVNVVADRDGKRRRIPPWIDDADGAMHLQVAVLMAADFLGVDRKSIRRGSSGDIHLGDQRTLPVDDQGYLLVHYAGKWKTYHHYSFADILLAHRDTLRGQEPLFDLSQLAGKVCFIGLTATGSHDISPVPLEPVYPMIGLHANVFNSIVTDSFIRRAGRGINVALLFVLMLLAAGLNLIPKPWQSFLVAVGVLSGYLLVSVLLFSLRHWWLDIFYPVGVFLAVYLSGLLWRAVQERRKRLLLETELTIAAKIQESFLPTVLPKVEGLDVAASMRPAKHVGGDLYSVFRLGEGQLGVMVGDVSGKGMPAALFMAKTVSEFKYASRSETDPSVVLRNLNESLSSETSSGLFVTTCYSVFDMKRRVMVLANGGHLPLLRLKASGQADYLNPKEGMPIALMEGVGFDVISVPLEPGDTFVYYTDGISEARNRKRQDYDTGRLEEASGRFLNREASDIQKGILRDLADFVGHAPQHDDMTLIVAKVLS